MPVRRKLAVAARCSVARKRGFIELGKKPLKQERKEGRKEEGSKTGKGRHRGRGAGSGLAGTRTQEGGRGRGSRRWEVLFWEEAVAAATAAALSFCPRRSACLSLPTFPSHKNRARGQNRAELERRGEERREGRGREREGAKTRSVPRPSRRRPFVRRPLVPSLSLSLAHRSLSSAFHAAQLVRSCRRRRRQRLTGHGPKDVSYSRKVLTNPNAR